ncbi:MAG: hypothetical protein R3B09_09330 [Nannocystaceae bacterium]
MTAPNAMNLWMAASAAERDALGGEAGVSPGDFCLVEGANLYVAVDVLDLSSTWRPIAGTPTLGPLAVGARNVHDTAYRFVFAMTSVTFRAVLDQPPSSITLTLTSSYNWPTSGVNVITADAFGMVVAGSSLGLAPGDTGWWRGTYTLHY